MARPACSPSTTLKSSSTYRKAVRAIDRVFLTLNLTLPYLWMTATVLATVSVESLFSYGPMTFLVHTALACIYFYLLLHRSSTKHTIKHKIYITLSLKNFQMQFLMFTIDIPPQYSFWVSLTSISSVPCSSLGRILALLDPSGRLSSPQK